MNTISNHGPAKIYQFPIGGRASLTSRPQAIATTGALPNGRAAALGSSWYHEEAIREDEHDRSVIVSFPHQ
jgi:hypothetical protein